MVRVPSALGVAAATAALVALPVQAAGAADAQTPVRGVLGACAELVDQGPGWASLRNDCGVEISGSVQLTAGTSPACVPIAPNGTNTVRWEGDGRAEYAFDC